MKRKIVLRLSLLAVLLTLLWSCRNEDFIQADKNPLRNNHNFFTHSKNGDATARAGVDYIDILEAYNRESDFLSSMPDQQGMPIWEKMQVVDTEHATGLMIPLSYDNETMSSVLFAILDDKNSVTGVKDYDNVLLERIVYNEDIDIQLREKMFYTFMYMDNKTFGNELFTNIPKGMMDDLKYDKDNGRIWIKDFTEPKQIYSETSKILYIENCGSSWSCKNHESWSKCDHCPACYTNSCSTTVIWIPDESFPGSPGMPGGGGGGGGGGSSIPPKDPCGLTTVFYRLAPGCGGGNTDFPDLNPCERYQLPVDNSNNILHTPNISTEMATMKNHAANSNIEYGTAIMSIGSSIVAQDPYTDNLPDQVTIHPASIGDYIANAHTHPCHGVAAPSLGDFYGDIKNIKNYPAFQAGYIFSCNGAIYAFVVEDRQKVIDFLNAFPEAENLSPNRQLINNNSQLGKDFNEILENYMTGSLPSYSGNSQRDGLESGLAQILEKYNSGMVLAKTDLNGDLKPLTSIKFQYTIPASGGKKITGYKAQPCP